MSSSSAGRTNTGSPSPWRPTGRKFPPKSSSTDITRSTRRRSRSRDLVRQLFAHIDPAPPRDRGRVPSRIPPPGDPDRKEREAALRRKGEHVSPRQVRRGTCPVCGNSDARGDQCENCGTFLDPLQLLNRGARSRGHARGP